MTLVKMNLTDKKVTKSHKTAVNNQESIGLKGKVILFNTNTLHILVFY